MPDEPSFSSLFRELRVENYRLALEMGDNAPLVVLFMAALHESAEYLKKEVLKEKAQPRLRNRKPILVEVWRKVTECNCFVYTQISRIRLLCAQLFQRVESPDVDIRKDIDETLRGIQTPAFQPLPLMDLLSICTDFSVLDDENFFCSQMLARCVLVKRLMERKSQIRANGILRIESIVAAALVWEPLPSCRKIDDRVGSPTATNRPVEGAMTASPEAPFPNAVGEAIFAALYWEPACELAEAMFAHFERNIVENLNQVPTHVASFLPANAAPSHGHAGTSPFDKDDSLPASPGGSHLDRSSKKVAIILLVRLAPPRASLDGKEFNLTDEQAAFLDILVRHVNQWVEPKIFDEVPILAGVRRDRIKRGLPDRLKKMITGKGGGGYKLVLA
jgi:hypothetical protein